RTVKKETSLIPYETNLYEVDPKLRGKRVEIRFNPFDLSKIYIYYQGEFKCIAKPYHILRGKHKKVKASEETRLGKKQPLQSSVSYFEALSKKAEKNKKQPLETMIPPAGPEPALTENKAPSGPALKFSEAHFYELMHEKLGKFTANERSRVKGSWKKHGPFDEKLTEETMGRTIDLKGKTENINYYLESIKREHFHRAKEMELYQANKKNIIKLNGLIKDLADKKGHK
ncbi:MAG: Mu transposase C-terminal domain-containing protein, partial [Candidatus Omnitrophica bacterium]|nr:Mu transposase C-terminal domain-containing protein [Candidatus Omnitrophota bacterium]